ncbi:DsrE family protein [Shewanella sp. OMA3-2]|uniref:DsrE family protein n=1 Tax=Shewanella sp. OMA3-2 TaxID=2908650 RepID=UPI001F1C7116|nr:DsrE family protein [Shewanella sp. OMA3-2]UJF21583.1 DsrE family protein [Shewanella sp. OMA3-2]
MYQLSNAVKIVISLVFLMLMSFSQISYANSGLAAFKPGVVIKDFGKVAEVDSQLTIPQNMKFKVAFDVGSAANAGEVNRQIDTLARFINMHVAAGVKPEDIELALVVHGKAAMDMTNNAMYQQTHKNTPNANQPLIAELNKYQVKFYVCGQTAAYYGISQNDLLPEVKLALSALTAHAVLAQQGYSMNPF